MLVLSLQARQQQQQGRPYLGREPLGSAGDRLGGGGTGGSRGTGGTGGTASVSAADGASRASSAAFSDHTSIGHSSTIDALRVTQVSSSFARACVLCFHARVFYCFQSSFQEQWCVLQVESSRHALSFADINRDSDYKKTRAAGRIQSTRSIVR